MKLAEMEGKFTLGEIELQIAGEEAGGSEFLESQIAHYNNRATNIGRFRELPVGTRPKRLTLMQGPPGSTPPAGTQGVWSGLMMVQNAPQMVFAVRQI